LGSPTPPIRNMMKIILKINLFLFTSSIKKLIFLFILLLLLPFTGCKSVVKETVVEEPVRIVSPNGFGVLTYPDGEKSVVGEWKDGKEWNTKHTKKDGTLIGKFVNGEWIGSWGVLYHGIRNGKGGYYEEKWEGIESEDDKNYSKYEGEIKNGLPNGQGTYTFTNGGKYDGEWKNGEPNGQGITTFPDGGNYIGEYKNEKRNGQGTHTWSDGRKYVGDYKDGVRHGHGTFTLPDGFKYEGEWKDGKQNGQGTETFPDGRKYVGKYKDGKQYGQGTETFPDGRKYEGQWKNGERNDLGTHTWSDGRKYVGDYKDGVKHGQGSYTFPSGEKYVGEWKKGNPWNITGYDKNGNIIGKIVNGEQQ